MKILVTGSSGQIGSLVARLLRKKADVIGLDLKPGPETNRIGSIADRRLISTLTRGLGAVIHTASLHAPHLPARSEEDFRETNVRGTRHLLECALENGVGRFVYTSTTSLYGTSMCPTDRAVWVTETLPPGPRDIYDLTKIEAENLCKSYADRHGLDVLALRVSRFFPEPEHLMAVYRLYRGVDVRDAAQAHLLAVESGLKGYDVMNISARPPFREEETQALFEDAAAVIRKHFPSAESAFAARGWTLPGSIDRVYVVEKAEKALGYRPRHNFLEYVIEKTA